MRLNLGSMLFQLINNKPLEKYYFFQDQDLCSRETFTRVNVLCAFIKPHILSPHLQSILLIYSYFKLPNITVACLNLRVLQTFRAHW